MQQRWFKIIIYILYNFTVKSLTNVTTEIFIY